VESITSDQTQRGKIMAYISVKDVLGTSWKALSVDGYVASAVDCSTFEGIAATAPRKKGHPHDPMARTDPLFLLVDQQLTGRNGSYSVHLLRYPGDASACHLYSQVFAEFLCDPKRERYIQLLSFAAGDVDPSEPLAQLLKRTHFRSKASAAYKDYARFCADTHALLEDSLHYLAHPAVTANAHLIDLGFKATRLSDCLRSSEWVTY
jgi:hypothetical protein